MIVTDITDIDKKRKRVYIDYEFAFSLYLGEIRKYNISVGSEITTEDYDELSSVVFKRAKMRAMYILKAAWKTRKQLFDKLVEGGYTKEQAEYAIEYVEKYGYINDEQYALNYAEVHSDKRSKNDIRIQLMRKGISSDDVDKALDMVEVDEDRLIADFINKKGFDVEEIPALDLKEKRRLYSALIRKGFSSQKISRLFNQF